MPVKIKDLKLGKWFTLKPIAEPKETQVYIKREYDRTEKKYYCEKWWDVSDGRYFSGDREVYVDFIF